MVLRRCVLAFTAFQFESPQMKVTIAQVYGLCVQLGCMDCVAQVHLERIRPPTKPVFDEGVTESKAMEFVCCCYS